MVCWGEERVGGNCTDLELDSSLAVYASWEAFAALQPDGSLICWGNPQSGGDCSGVTGLGVPTMVASTCCAFAALKADKSVVCWGNAKFGGNCAALGLTDTKAVYATGAAFAAVQEDDSVTERHRAFWTPFGITQ